MSIKHKKINHITKKKKEKRGKEMWKFTKAQESVAFIALLCSFLSSRSNVSLLIVCNCCADILCIALL